MKSKTKTNTSKRTSAKKILMLEALEKSLGVVSTACKIVDINRNTHYEWLKKDEEYKKAVEEIDNYVIDFVESQLHSQIKEGNTTATIFYLKTKGKKRGYVESIDLMLNDTEIPRTFEIVSPHEKES